MSPLSDPSARLWSIDLGVVARGDDGRPHVLVCDDLSMEWDSLGIPVEPEGEVLTERLLRSLVKDDAAFRRNKARRDRVARRRKGGEK